VFRPLYLDVEPDAVFALHHPAAGETGVVIVPPFGWDDVCSYRARRDWALSLSRAGHPVLRLDLPGSGDSGGHPADPERLAAWTSAVAATAAWLRAEGGASRVAAVGIGLGGMLAWRAAAQGAPMDDLVLWGTPARGKTLLRELRAFERMEAEQFAADGIEVPPPPVGTVVVGGFAVHTPTMADLEALDLTELPLPGDGRRVLLLERDGIGVDARLREHLMQSDGVELTVAPGPGWGEMMEEPQFAKTPDATIEAVTNWLADARVAPAAPLPHDAPSAAAAFERDRVRESAFTDEQPFGRLFGVVSQPLGERAPLSLVLLNAGAIRRIGPGRLWVEAARRWAARGVPAARLDLEGIGDADGDAGRFRRVMAFYTADMVGQVRAGLDALEQRGVEPPYVLAGLCSGAFWSFHGAIEDDRVAAAVMLNPRLLTPDEFVVTRREAKRAGKVTHGAKRKEVARGEKPLSLLLSIAWAGFVVAMSSPGKAFWRTRARRGGGDDVDRSLDRLRDAGKAGVLAFTDAEPLHDEFEHDGRLERLSRWPNLRLEAIGAADHTLRPPSLQKRAHELIDAAVERELAKRHHHPA
jgi:alpha-beta hydrolase superfamily lysophospholipase